MQRLDCGSLLPSKFTTGAIMRKASVLLSQPFFLLLVPTKPWMNIVSL